MSTRQSPPRLLTIAGSDSGGGAGIQADLKTFMAHHGYGMSVITAVTAQNTLGVRAVHDIPPDIVRAQLDAVLEDIGADAIKTGMLSNAAIIECIAQRLAAPDTRDIPLVVDPVMIATSGDPLLRQDARTALANLMLPLADVLTPNLAETEALTGIRVSDDTTRHQAGRALIALGPKSVVIKGGHGTGDQAVDWLYDGATWESFSAPRRDTQSTHGTGCTFAAAIAAGLGTGLTIPKAVARAKHYLDGALQQATPLGAGHGPVAHDWALRDHNK